MMSRDTAAFVVRLDPVLYQALRITAAATDQTVSELVNEAVRFRLAEDEADLKAFGARANEPSVSFQS
jgi:predicted transcriptional regulator